MEPINLLLAINLFVSLSANWSAAKKGLKSSFTQVKEKPKTYLQKIPPNISALVLVMIILGVFNLGVFPKESTNDYEVLKYVGLGMFILFSWLQVYAFKSLGKNYSQELVIFKEHSLVTKGIFGVIRHPQYLFQLLSDLGAGMALVSYLILPVVIFIELPLFILRAKYEDKLLEKSFWRRIQN